MTRRRSGQTKNRRRRSNVAQRAREPRAQFLVTELARPNRLDRLLRSQFPTWGRRAVQSTITAGNVRVNGRKVWLCSWQVKNGDRIEIDAPPQAKPSGPTRFDDAWLLDMDEQIIAVNKPAGLLCHATRWTDAVNLLDLAQARFGAVTLFHRLDRDTSGVVLLTRTRAANRYLDQAFRTRAVTKEYVALVATPNRLVNEGEIIVRIGKHPRRRDMQAVVERGGQHAVTRYRVETQTGPRQLVRLWPLTGRTHQLRVHLAHMGAPILGDRLYGPKPKRGTRLMLHARCIELPDAPDFHARRYACPLPTEFQSVGLDG